MTISIGLIASIIGINVVYVSIFTLRLILMIKNRRALASFLSMAEVFVYLMGLNLVLQNLDNPFNMAAYCLGFGLGVYLGSRIEEYLALGYLVVQVIVDSLELDLAAELRDKGYGVTSWTADGKEGKRLVLQVLVKRSNERRLMDTLKKLSPHAFIISHEPKNFKGGFWVKLTEGRRF
ncbi:DUF2179 domain-containing protein [Paenibacillus sp. F411]|uniref:UPF0316 protein E6C60_3604 n=1 Tax=Paenibacillus algicola TaxID=2565926 RepID=A0A4V1G4D5_9BACL|nr:MULTISPECIES: DUF2179 domain-containing protein [Paenibacillus]MBO2945589.1 DUF2179 domain-containing protein [Paenibacillus sp. F411]QCT04314.1 Protein of unknown function DUF2179 [Paenibacillus algicola]